MPIPRIICPLTTRGRCCMPFPYLSNFIRTLPYKPHPFTGALIQNIWEMGIKTYLCFTGVCLPECVYLGVLTWLSAVISAETWGCSSKLRASIINGSPGNSLQCVSQKSSGRGEGRALWPNTDVVPAELEEGLKWNQIIIKIITLSCTLLHSEIY